jgi:hypothetical protein
LTGLGGEAAVRRCDGAGIDQVFVKPYDAAGLWRALDTSVPARAR